MVEWLPDGNGKHGEALWQGLCRLCSGQPELKPNNVSEVGSLNLFFLVRLKDGFYPLKSLCLFIGKPFLKSTAW